MAAIACSRMPKCRFFPPGCRPGNLPRLRTSESSCSMARDPQNRRGTTGCFARARSAPCPRRPGPAMPFASAGNTGRLRSQPPGSSRRCICSIFVGELGISGLDRPRTVPSTSRRTLRRVRPCPPRNARTRRPERGTSHPRASHSCAWSAGPLRRRAARHELRRCPACAASHSRCGCPE